jgi:iron complex transport system ATP-binding protein
MSALMELRDARVALSGRVVVEGVNLQLRAGEVVALLGPNGAGKTTLMRAGLGLIPLSAGEAVLSDVPASSLNTRDRALQAAYLPQRPQSVWPVRVEELVALGRYAHGAAPDRLGDADQAAVDAALESCSLQPLRARRMDQISGGETARAHLARALAQRAPLLVLDEPTAGLDPAQALAVVEIMRGHAAEDGGVLVSMHDVSLAARAADRIVLMKEGRVLAEGAPEVALTPETLRDAYGRAARVECANGALAVQFV